MSSPGRRPIPREFVSLSQRERMLAAVAEVVAERGYPKTTIESIAKTARVALATFYEHFDSKEECFLAAFDESVAAAAELLVERMDGERPWVEQISAGLEGFLELVVAEQARAKLCIVEAQAAGRAGLIRYHSILEGVVPKLREGRALSPRAGRLPEGLEPAIAGGLMWLVYQRLASGRAADLEGLLPDMLEVTLTPYVGELEAGRVAEAAQARALA